MPWNLAASRSICGVNKKNQLEPRCVAVVRHIFSDVRSNMDMERYGYATNLTSRPARSHMHSVYRLDPHVFGSPKTDFDLSDQAMRTSVSVWDCKLPAAFPDWTALTYCWMRRDKPPAVSKRACTGQVLFWIKVIKEKPTDQDHRILMFPLKSIGNRSNP